jgi:DNA-binding response OmpR family regulator
LKGDKATCKKPIIVTSAGVQVAEKGGACKADDVLKKPFDIENFQSLVKSHLTKKLKGHTRSMPSLED